MQKRHIGAARQQNPQHPLENAFLPAAAKADPVAFDGALLPQPGGDLPRPLHQLPVGNGPVLTKIGSLIGGKLRAVFDHPMHRLIQIRGGQKVRLLPVGQPVPHRKLWQLVHCLRRIPHHPAQNGFIASGVQLRRLRREQAGGVLQDKTVAILLLIGLQAQIQLGAAGRDRQIGKRLPVQHKAVGPQGAQGKQRLIQRVLRKAARKLQHRHQLFQRHGLMVQQACRFHPQLLQKVGHGHLLCQCQPQRQSIQKRAADPPQLRLQTPGNRRADQQIPLAADGGQKDAVGRRKQHKRGDPLLTAQLLARFAQRPG